MNLLERGDEIEIFGLLNLAPNSKLTLKIYHRDGSTDEILLNHSFSTYQIKWFKAGSALNYIKSHKLMIEEKQFTLKESFSLKGISLHGGLVFFYSC